MPCTGTIVGLPPMPATRKVDALNASAARIACGHAALGFAENGLPAAPLMTTDVSTVPSPRRMATTLSSFVDSPRPTEVV